MGLVCAATLLAMANPGVGRQGHGWKTALAAALLFPLAATILAIAGQPSGSSGTMQSGIQCLTFSFIGGLATAMPMGLGLRRGAPGEDRIPGALEHVVAAGVTWTTAADRAFATLRLRHFGAYPLLEDDRVRASPTTLVNASAGLRVGGVRVQVSVLNVLGSRANDIQYYYASRLPGEPAGGIGDVHSHPVEPRQLRLALVRGL